jgi:hypothetical protein
MPIGESLDPLWASGKLQVGRQWAINMLDPRDLTLTQALVQVVGEGERAWRGKRVRTYQLKVSYEGNGFEAEVTADGELLRQTISWPLRLTLIREEGDAVPSGPPASGAQPSRLGTRAPAPAAVDQPTNKVDPGTTSARTGPAGARIGLAGTRTPRVSAEGGPQ